MHNYQAKCLYWLSIIIKNHYKRLTKNNIDGQVLQNSNLLTDERNRIIVLIVEDDLMNQLTIKKFLEKRFGTIITDSSDKVIEILNSNKINIILMDISILGKMNGLELTTLLKKSSEYSHIPIIAVTAHAFKKDKQNAMEVGCDNYLAKPFSQQSLIDMIDVSIGQSKQRNP